MEADAQGRQEEKVKELTAQLAEAYAQAATADAMKNESTDRINQLRHQLSRIIIPADCVNDMGWCAPEGLSMVKMSECDCLHGYSGCTWNRDGPPPWLPAATVFGELCQILAESYMALGKGAGMPESELEKAANERVVHKLGQLLNEANRRECGEIGTCVVTLTDPPSAIRMTQDQCARTPGGIWQGQGSEGS